MRPNNIEDIYPLSPTQQGILFHTLSATEPGTYVVQIAWTLRGHLDVEAFLRAFQDVVDRHPALRTAFAWEKLDAPVQIVWKRLKLACEQQDLRALPPAEQAERVRRFTDEDRRKGFDPTRAPLLRVALLRLSDDAYRFVWSMHHLLLDGWSTQIVVKEIFGRYDAITKGREVRFERVRPYGEYIGWLKKQDAGKVEAFWRGELRGFSAPTPLDLPAPASPPAEPFGEARLALPEAAGEALSVFARKHELTLNTLVQGAWAILLSRYAREEDVVFGATVSGRSAPVPGIEGMVGLFINTLPVRARTRGDEPALAFLSALQRRAAEARDFEHSALVEVQGWSEVPRGTPLFESLVVFENFPIAETVSKGQKGPLAITEGQGKEQPPYPITLSAIFQRSLQLTLGYDARRFARSAVDRLLGHLAVLIQSIVAAPATSIARLPMLTEAEIAMLATFHGPVVDHPNALLHELVEAQVERTPDAIAVSFEGRTLSYRALEEQANRLASALVSLGVGPDTLVGVALERSLELPVALYAVLKAGGAYVPIDPSYPADRIAFMLEEAGAPVVLTDKRTQAVLPALPAPVRVIAVDGDPALATASKAKPTPSVGPDHLAYVIFTSGSTGRPKGAMIPHRAIVNHMRWMHATYPSGEGRAVLQKTPISFDASVWEIWLPLMGGGRLVMASPDGHRDARYMVQAVIDERITELQLVPAMAELVAQEPELSRCTSLSRIFLGGEALSRALVTRLKAGLGVAVVNLYGPTECAVQTVVWQADPERDTALMEPIGRPIDNVRAHILDASLGHVPVGVAGELCIGGPSVGRGYWRRPDLTEQAFVADPFASHPGDRIYRTGDLCRFREDGVIEYLGRIDHQIKLRGFRIELGEIEAALAEQPSVREAVVVAREDGAGKRLVAYVVAKDASLSVVALRAALAARLPEYMVPGAFVTLDALPLTTSGKIDRRAFPAPDASALVERAYVAPRSPVEQALAGIFAEVLKLPPDGVGATDGFFDLGGHSLLATQAVSRVRAALGVELPIRALFEAPVVADLAARVEASLRGAGEASAPPLAPVLRGGDRPLSFGQERLWFVAQLDPTSPAYVIPLALRLRGALDAGALERALSEVVRRHEVLRTTFESVAGKPVQRIHPPAPLPLPRGSLAALPEAERERAARAEAEAEARRPFDLAHGPVIRAKLLEMGESDHLLLLTMHHVVSDAWTSAILGREITAIYEAFRRGEPSPLPELPIQYADYAAWQRAYLSGEVLDRQLAYWKKQLEGALPSLDLPTDRPRPPAQSFRGAQRFLSLGPELSDRIKELSRKEGATLYMTLLAAFDLLLHRYTGQDDIVVGTPIAGRARAETESLVGFFLNTLVMRARLTPDLTFKEVIARVKETALGAYAHQDLPFERLVQEIQPDPDPSRSPLFQVIFNLQNAPRGEVKISGVEARASVAENQTVKVDLTLIMGEGPRGLVGRIEYSTDLFDASTIERFVKHFETLLTAVAKDPQKRVRELSCLPEDERRRLLVEWNGTATESAAQECFHELFEAAADEAPDALALVAGSTRLSYAELDARANRLARHLRARGVGPDAVVGICLDRSADLVIALLGVLKAGGAYVPLDASYPARRLAQIIEDARASVVITHASLAEKLPASGVTLVRLDTDAEGIAGEDASRLPLEATPASLAYVLFTSGSTGTPKGVAIEHRQLVNYVRGVTNRIALPRGASYAYVSTFSADLGNTMLFPALAGGGCLHVITQDLTTDPDALAAYSQREGIDCMKIVPSHLSALLGAAHPDRVIPRKLLVLGGEAASWELIDKIERLAPDCRILNHYGPTETTVGVLTYDVQPSKRPATAIVPLGRPLANSRIYVLDAEMQPTPTGVPGEVYIGGAGVARGYLNRPDLTAERFLKDPFSSAPGARLYKTGDRARYLPDGTLLFLGRIDFQVKIRGFRIELGEIEAALAACPALKDAAVIVEEQTPGDKRLVAFVVPHDPAPDMAMIRGFVEQRLPEYMVPSAFVVLDALPLTPNGKVDRKALAAVERSRDQEGYAAPRTPVEEVLAAIWADVFERDRVGIHERFNDLGGHSLLAIQIVARARDAFQVQVPLRAIFEAPTIGQLAARIEELRVEDERLVAPPLTPAPRDGRLPLSFAQERLWFLDRLEPNSAFYNVSSATRLAGALDVGALERAVSEVMRRHEVLRTTFALDGGSPVQIIHPPAAITLPIVDLSTLPPEAREEAARREAAAEAQRPFDLERGPILRVRLIRLAADDHVLCLTLHHIASDARTQAVLSDEIAKLYEAFKRGAPSSLPELPVQYADYAVWQRRWLSGEVLYKQLAFWKHALAGAPTALDLPADRPRPPVLSYRGARRSFAFSQDLSRRLAELSKRQGVTLFMTLLAAFDVLLHRWSGQETIVVGTPMTNRSRPEIDDLIGFFLNTLVIRADVDESLTFEDLIQRVREACLGAYAHQDMPFERLVHELAPERDMSRTPLFQVLFTLQSAPREERGLSGVRRRGLGGVTSETAKWDLAFFLVEGPRGISGSIEYATDLFDGSTVDRMAAQLAVLLESAVAAPDRPLAELPLLPEAEFRLVQETWNATQATYPDTATIADLFEAQVDRTPDAPAVSFAGKALTFRALDEAANRLANRLVSRGVTADTTVGIAMQRGLDLVVSVLAVLKAGGAYVPLDPEYPKERLAFMLEDTRVPLLLVQERFAGTMPSHGARILRIDTGAPEFGQGSAARPSRTAVGPDHLAYVIFTSGSTGRPKGVAMPHRPLVNLVAWQLVQTGVPLRTIQLTSPSFDVFFQELFTTWCAGAELVLISEEVRRDAVALRQAIADAQIERVFLPPVALYQLAETQAAPLPASLKEVIVAGEQIQVTTRVAELLSTVPGVMLRNHYGPSESHVVTEHVLTGSPGAWPALPPIGKPVQNAEIYLLDARRRPVPIGVPGELYIGGLVLARGYVERPDLTAERFVDSPFGRLYRTGDLARYRPDGVIEFLGRVDHQVKIRGYRVELGEIEAVLAQYSSVRDVVVVARAYGQMDKRLVAYLVKSDDGALVLEDLRAFLKARLPDYMVPSAFVALDALPLTPTGKVDRKALPAPTEAASVEAKAKIVLPRDETEIRIAAIWREVLGKQSVGVTESFFDLGGHSLLAVRMMSEVEQAFGKKIPLVALFESQTIEALGALVRRGVTTTKWPSLVPIRASGSKRPLFLIARPNVNSLGYIALVRHLDREQPVYGLQMQYPEEEQLGRPYTLEERRGWVAHYLDLMRAVQPEGPYLLAGMCEGSLIAFEMVRRLEAEGQRVVLLGMLDTWPEENTSHQLLHRVFLYQRRLRDVWRSPRPQQIAFVKSRTGKALRRIADVFRTPDDRRVPPRPKMSPWDVRMFPGQSFVPPTVSCRIDVFRTKSQPYWRLQDPELGWGSRTTGGVDVHYILGDHDTFMREENVGPLAAQLRECLGNAEEEIARLALALPHKEAPLDTRQGAASSPTE